MKKIVPLFLALAGGSLLTSCDTATPETHFAVAVINCNLMQGFAAGGLEQRMQTASTRLNKNGEEVPYTRKEIVEDLTQNLENSFAKIKGFKQNDDNREMLQASLALYEYALPVYRNEYQQLAKLYDEGAPREQIESLVSSIETKYRAEFESRFDRLTAAGKPFAERHQIKVTWDVSTVPKS